MPAAGAGGSEDYQDPSKKSRGNFDIGIMSRALAITNATKARNADEDATAQMGAVKRHAGKGKLYAWGSGDYGRLGCDPAS